MTLEPSIPEQLVAAAPCKVVDIRGYNTPPIISLLRRLGTYQVPYIQFYSSLSWRYEVLCVCTLGTLSTICSATG